MQRAGTVHATPVELGTANSVAGRGVAVGVGGKEGVMEAVGEGVRVGEGVVDGEA